MDMRCFLRTHSFIVIIFHKSKIFTNSKELVLLFPNA